MAKKIKKPTMEETTETIEDVVSSAPAPEDLLMGKLAGIPGIRVEKASEVRNSFTVRIPTGVMSLDVACGGGIPAGGITEAWGPANAGKSSICSMLIRQCQRVYGEESRVAVFGIEHEMDKGLARKLGAEVAMSDKDIKADEEVIGRPYTAEERERAKQQIGAISMIGAATAEDALEAVYRIAAMDYYQLLIIDSIAQLLPNDEKEAAISEGGMLGAALPRLISRFLRKMTDAYFQRPNGRPNMTAIVVTNQVTANIGGYTRPGMPPPQKQKGGYSLTHGKLLSLKLRKSGNDEDSQIVHWAIDKGKAGTHSGMSGEFTYSKDFSNFGPDYREITFKEAVRCGTIVRRGGVFDVECMGISGCHGKEALFREMSDIDPEWYFGLYNDIMTRNNIHVSNKWES